MSTQIQRRRGTTAQHASFTGAIGETTIDTDKEVVVVHDGTQVGGYPLMRENGSNSALALGSAATPSLKFTGDTNTGIYSPGADQVAISTGGSGRLFIDSSGRLGVGVSSPSSILDINGDLQQRNGSGITIGKVENNGGWYSLTGDSGNVNGAQVAHSTTVRFLTASTERLRIDSSGRVGIGTSAPAGKVNILGSTAAPSLTYDTADVVNIDAGTIQLAIGVNSSAPFGAYFQGRDNGNGSRIISLNPAGGNVGIGTTSVSGKLDVAGTVGTFSIATDGATVNFTRAGANYIQAAETGATLNYRSGEHIFTGTSLANERARIDSSGRLLVGTSSSFMSGGLLQVKGSGTYPAIGLQDESNTGSAEFWIQKRRGTSGSPSIVQSGNGLGSINFSGWDGSSDVKAAQIEAIVDGTPGANDMPGRLVFSTTADGAASPTERMRISQNGTISLGTAGAINTTLYVEAGTDAITTLLRNANSGSNVTAIGFRNSGGSYVGAIYCNNSNTTYSTTSDYRLKENVEPITGAAARILQLKPRRFNFIANPDQTVDGFIAHEAAEAVPECVVGTKDEVDADGNPIYQGIDQSKLVPLLTAALQEAIGEIASLKDRVAALEGA